MTCRTDTAGMWAYRACPDDPPAAADRLRAVVRWSAVDEITQAGPNVDFVIRTESLGLVPRVARDGFMGLVGNPGRLYPGLDLGSVEIAWSVSAPGYLVRERTITLGPIAGFPDQFTPVDDGVLQLHREPLVLRGRAFDLVANAPMPGLAVAITGVWWTFPPSNVDPTTVMKPAQLVSLHPGLHADRSLGVVTLRRRDLAHVPAQDKTLVRPAVRGTATARLSDRVGVIAGTILAFEPTRADRVEYVAVTAVAGASTDDQPATVTLAHRLLLDHEEATDVHVVAPQLPAAAHVLDRDGVRADRVAFLGSIAGVTAGIVEISGGAAPAEYQTASLYSTTSNGDGYYRLPPLSRVASVKLQTPALVLVTSPDYGRYENLVDLVHP
ncbi:MAG: hypothetical protein WKG01_09925 [Kofleriaceae bacterium]